MQMEEVLYAYDSSSIQFAYAHLRFGWLSSTQLSLLFF